MNPRIPSLLLALSLYLPGALRAQVVNPADKAKENAGARAESPQSRPETWTRAWPLTKPEPTAPLEPGGLREEQRIGSYQQPEWTAQRLFGETRVYVVPEGQAEFEFWYVPKVPRHGEPVENKLQYEFEFGLPYRFQIDLYLVQEKSGNTGEQASGNKFEVRWALADWDVIPANPTLYLEWVQNDGAADHVEAKLLLGGELAQRWHWGSNLVFEHETGGAYENSHEFTTGVGYSVIDQKLSLGVETKLALVNVHGARSHVDTELLVGPSLQFRPLPRAHIDLAPLIGVTTDAPQLQVFFVFGWQF